MTKVFLTAFTLRDVTFCVPAGFAFWNKQTLFLFFFFFYRRADRCVRPVAAFSRVVENVSDVPFLPVAFSKLFWSIPASSGRDRTWFFFSPIRLPALCSRETGAGKTLPISSCTRYTDTLYVHAYFRTRTELRHGVFLTRLQSVVVVVLQLRFLTDSGHNYCFSFTRRVRTSAFKSYT